LSAVDAAQLTEAVARLRVGELVGMPTETVYGLAGDARNSRAIAKIFALKGRPPTHPLIVHLAAATQIEDWAREIPPMAWELARRYWPGPLSLVLKRTPGVLDAVTAGQDTIALRVPAHPVAQALLQAFGDGLAAPSANRYQHVSPTTAAHVRAEFGAALPIVLDGGASTVGIESSIVDLSQSTPRILRLGMLRAADFGDWVRNAEVNVPGSDARHYAPDHPAELVASTHWLPHLEALTEQQVRFSALCFQASPGASLRLAAASDPQRYAHDLYAHLRAMSAANVDRIVIERPPLGAEWAAIHDRLQRACTAAPA
jgi:L-threonylcarbamoyladenylate synthase